MRQWQLFNEDFLAKKGVTKEFYPFSYQLQKWKVCSMHYTDKTGKSDLPKDQRIVFVGCKQARRHIDGVNNPTHAAILVLRNDGLIAKPYHKPKVNYRPQLPGTVIILNIHQYHHCIPDNRVQKRDGGFWIGLSIEYQQYPSVEQIETSFRSIMSNFTT